MKCEEKKVENYGTFLLNATVLLSAIPDREEPAKHRNAEAVKG